MEYTTSPRRDFIPVPRDDGRPWLALGLQAGGRAVLWIRHGEHSDPGESPVPWLKVGAEPKDSTGRIARVEVEAAEMAPGRYAGTVEFGDQEVLFVLQVSGSPQGEPAGSPEESPGDGRPVEPAASTSGPWRSPVVLLGLPFALFLLGVLAFDKIYYRSAALVLESYPPGARVVLDGVDRGSTPLKIRWLAPGQHRVELQEPSAHPEGLSVELEAFSSRRQVVRLAPKTLVVEPGGAGAYGSAQQAVEAARPGSTILLRPGTHSGPLSLEKDLEVRGEGGRDATTLSSFDAAPLLVKSGNVRIVGLSIRFDPAGSDARLPAMRVEGGSAVVEDCTVTSSSWASLTVSGGDTQARLINCEFPSAGASGLFLFDGGRADLEGCALSANTLAGLEVKEKAEATVKRCTFSNGASSGAFVLEEGKATFEDCTFSGHGATDVTVTTGGTADLLRCTLENGQGNGVTAEAGGVVTVSDSSLRGHSNAEVRASGGGRVTVRASRLSDSRQSGAYVHEDGRVTLDGCVLSGNGLAGVEAAEGGEARLTDGTVEKGKMGGVLAHSRGRLYLQRCKVVENRYSGVEARTGGFAELRGSEVQRNRQNAVYVHDRGVASVHGCDLRFNRRKAWSTDISSTVDRSDNLE